MDVIELLGRIHPFRFLRSAERLALQSAMVVRTYAAGETIFHARDADQSVYLLESGLVEVFDPGRTPAYATGGGSQPSSDVVRVIPAYHSFGEWEAIFDEPRMYGVRAQTAVKVHVITATRFRQLLRDAPGLATGFATILRNHQGIFAPFDRFTVELLNGAANGYLNIERLIPLYRQLTPALHRGAMDPVRIDTEALLYAVRRLPENVTHTFAFLLVDELPAAMSNAEELFPAVHTAARRRDIWEVLPGKNLVLLRTGNSDLIDLVTTLCLYAVEAQKIRERVIRDDSLHRIQRYLTSSQPSAPREFLETLAFSSREIEGLERVWPEDTVQRISEIVRHREMFGIDVRRQQRDHLARRGELWTGAVAEVTRQLIGCDPAELPPERAVHIISSNTHSVTNCLNPWFTHHAAEIESWARETNHPASTIAWDDRSDMIYVVAREYFAAHPDARREAERVAKDHGHMQLGTTASTGIQVQLVDLTQLRDAPIDAGVASRNSAAIERGDLVVNIDYAFGEQAQYVIRNLLTLYGPSVRSVSFLGKAGALVGARGDVLAPTAFIEQHSDRMQPLPDQTVPEHLTVHHGPMLTVDGTLVQNRQMLGFYQQLRDVIGMEMEGTHYYREIIESRQLGVIPPDTAVRFLYYVSDLPLAPHGNLATPLGVHEGVPPLYAITRHILRAILSEAA